MSVNCSLPTYCHPNPTLKTIAAPTFFHHQLDPLEQIVKLVVFFDILDPKAALKDDVKAIFRQYGRESDLIIVDIG